MDRSNSAGSNSSSSMSISRTSSTLVLSIECLKGGSKADEWTGDTLQTGDIVEEIKIGNMSIKSPFKNGKSGVQKTLHNSFKAKDTFVNVRVRRGPYEFTELQACVVPSEFSGKSKQYMLRSIDDPNYAVGFVDRTEAECFELQATRTSRLVNALARSPFQDGYVSYPWLQKMQESLPVPNSSCFYSILLLPKASDKASYRYNDLEDTLARANAWLNASQETGVPIVFMNIQTESLLTKISGDTASSTVSAGSLSDLSNLANSSLYGFEDYHGVDIGVVRAVRLWFSPLGGEIPVEIKIKEDDMKLGFAISRTEEGFIYISSVLAGDDDTPSSRSGLHDLFKQSSNENRLLVISRISNQKVLPWIVSPSGAIRCFDTVSLSQKLSLHRHAKVPILVHVFLWDRSVGTANVGSIRSRSISPPMLPLPPEVRPSQRPNENQVMPIPQEGLDESRLQRDTAGEFSFRFHDFSLANNWV